MGPMGPMMPILSLPCQVKELELQEADYERLNKLEGVYDWLPRLDGFFFGDAAGENN